MTTPDMRKILGSPCSFFQKLSSKTSVFWRLLYVFQLQVQGFTKPNRCGKKNCTTYRIFFKNRQNLPDTFLLELRKKKMGVTVLVFALQTKLSPTVIDTVAKRPKKGDHTPSGLVQDRCIQWIGHGAVCWTLNFGPAQSPFASGPAGDRCPSTSQLGRATLNIPKIKLHRKFLKIKNSTHEPVSNKHTTVNIGLADI